MNLSERLLDFPIRRVARVTIEFATPFHIGTGRGNLSIDALVVTDANGLPSIPGTSLAGVMRGLFLGMTGDGWRTDRLFGWQKGDQGCGSRLSVSWGCIHRATDRPVEGILPADSIQKDLVLKNAQRLWMRDHVRIDHHGAAHSRQRGKFDEQKICAGHRFTFELELTDQETGMEDWKLLLSGLASPLFRLGGKTRRGYGAFKLVRIATQSFDLREAADFNNYCAHEVRLSETCEKLEEMDPLPESHPPALAAEFRLGLQPRGYWLFGEGSDLFESAREPDMAPVRDHRIEWAKGPATKKWNGSVAENLLVLPGTALKGALSHRVAFHYNALVSKRRAETAGGRELEKWSEANEAVETLFGFVHTTQAGYDKADQKRGNVFLDDIFIVAGDLRHQLAAHNSIDRFGGGTRAAVLFLERAYYGWQKDSPIDLPITVLNWTALDPKVQTAFREALLDLVGGRLQIGGGSGRGQGHFEGRIEKQPAEATHD